MNTVRGLPKNLLQRSCQLCQNTRPLVLQRCAQQPTAKREYRRLVKRPKSRDARSVPSYTLSSEDLINNDFPPPIPPKHPDLVVREYEQHGSDRRTRVQIDPDREVRDEASEVWSELQKLEKELAILRQGPFGPESPLMQSLPTDEREKLLKTLAEEGVSKTEAEDALDLAELDRMMERQEDDREDEEARDTLSVTLRIPRGHQAFVNRFNKALAEAQEANGDIEKSLNLWKWYLRCQQRLSTFSDILPERVWQFLWRSQSELNARPRHIVMLAQDMLKAGESLTDEQKIEYIRCLYDVSDIAGALSVWEHDRANIGRAGAIVSSFYSLGIQLYGALGRPSQAQRAAYEGLNRGGDPKILIHLVSAWAKDKSVHSAVKAWTAYLKLRTLLGEEMNTTMFEKVSNAFLDADRQDMALTVFRDLVSQVREGQDITLKIYQDALGNIDQGKSPEDIEKAINGISLTSLLILPKEYQNKYFFASWIKKLIGEHRIQAAYKVVELMYQRNITPDAIHLNGILGAWLREGTPKSREQAEKLAWDMIQARIQLVERRIANQAPRNIGSVFRRVMQVREENNTWAEPVHRQRPICAANTETVSLLLGYYEQRSKWEEFGQLTLIMTDSAQLRPNTYIVNRWLAAKLRERSPGEVWSIYNMYKQTLMPDLETFSIMWQAAKLHYGPRWENKTAESREFPSSRRLFQEMMIWAQRLRAKRLDEVQDQFGPGLYAEIVRCFCQQADLPGTNCAVQGLSNLFGVVPDDVSIRLITGQVARMLPSFQPSGGPTSGKRSGRVRFNHKLSGNRSLLAELAEVIGHIEAKHKLDLVEQEGVDPGLTEDPQSEVSRQMRVGVMTSFLTMMMSKIAKHGEDYEKTIRDVALVMAVDTGQSSTTAGKIASNKT